MCSIYGQSGQLSIVTIGLASLPTERYKRNVIRGTLDLVIMIGSIAGLFIGMHFWIFFFEF